MNDRQLVDSILNQRTSLFEELFERYQGFIKKTVLKHVSYDHAEDVIQEVFIKIYKSLDCWKGNDNLKAFIRTIAVRTCYDFWRKHYKQNEVSTGSLSEKQLVHFEKNLSEITKNKDEEALKKEEKFALLEHVLAALGPEDKMVVELCHFEKLNYKEAARLLGWSGVNVRVRLFRARKKMKKIIEKMTQGGLS